ncbi:MULTISPECIES: hypothetical protein [Vibrio]|uniref:hypothetical protein n=1 Tax=Vibrio TaxID=662 RepID=UPI0001B941BF|nr:MULTISPECIES: hypothetical protein [Vibrio]EEX34548.1 hypothetical protein VIC_001348 [Vibrio coralliilyticus ATCC BAA-450]MDE3898592.1 hypothetical protein [Vibrio sp. CC007]
MSGKLAKRISGCLCGLGKIVASSNGKSVIDDPPQIECHYIEAQGLWKIIKWDYLER